ncbi:hypothetical protein C0583_03650 [Candidatus Parcubacteria bacterium]|nr:MAG: hypothetical protein C0583_03650 [Candidatus Parcubacteria bacterium]
MKKSLLKNNQGFTLIELLVSFIIITSSVLGIFSLIIQNIQVQKINKDQLIASQLAQEGLELVRNIRDYNWLHDDIYDTWYGITGGSSVEFSIIDYNDSAEAGVTPVTGISDPQTRLYKNANGFYTHDVTGTATQFSRVIKIEYDDITSPEQIMVESNVQWEINGKTYNYIADTILYDWR